MHSMSHQSAALSTSSSRDSTHLAALQESLQDLGHLWGVVQEQQALAYADPVRLLHALVQLDQQPQHLRIIAKFLITRLSPDALQTVVYSHPLPGSAK